MIRRYLLTAKKENKTTCETNYETFFTIKAAEDRQLVFINCGYKTEIIPLDIDLACHEIEEHYENEIEKENILNDFLYRLKEHHSVSEDDFDDIEEDIDIIYLAFKKCEDSNLSYWENIERTLYYLKDIKEDIDIVYRAFKKCEDSNLSYEENIERTIYYLKNIKNTHYDYRKIN